MEAGSYDVVIDPTNLFLTIHESIGHATGFDRAMGYEAAYAGTSFATPDKLGTLQYGSPVMHITGDRTVAHGLATVAIDSEGVEAQAFDIVRDGVLVGYQLDRTIATVAGLGRWNGCAFADSPLHVPIHPMANVLAGPLGSEWAEHRRSHRRAGAGGIYIVGDKSWSIDMQRYNFQFTGQRFFRIFNGQAGQAGARGCHTRPRRRSSGAPWRPWAASRPGSSAVRSTAGKGQPGHRWHRWAARDARPCWCEG